MAFQQSRAHGNPPPPFASALLLADQEANAAADRIALRGAGLTRIRVASSGVDTARRLAERVSSSLPPETELIVCLPQLRDMTAADFAALIRAHPLLPHIPLLAITPDQGQEPYLRQCGFDIVLLRPFTTTALINQMHAAAEASKSARDLLIASLRQQTRMPSHEAFDELLARHTPPDKDSMTGEAAFAHSVTLMRDRQWEDALPFLRKAAQEGSRQGDANMAMAVFWQASREPVKEESSLLEAFQGYLETREWGKLRKVASRLAAEYPGPSFPLGKEIERRARLNQPETVVELVRLAQGLLPEDEIIEAVRKGGNAAPMAEQTMPALLEVLKESGYAELAGALEPAPPDKTKKKRRPWFHRDKAAPVPLARMTASSSVKSAGENSGESAATPPAPGDTSMPAPGGPVIAPLGQDESDSVSLLPSLLPSLLGDAGAIIRGTMRLYKGKK